MSADRLGPNIVEQLRCERCSTPCVALNGIITKAEIKHTDGDGSQANLDETRQMLTRLINNCPVANRDKENPQRPCIDKLQKVQEMLN